MKHTMEKFQGRIVAAMLVALLAAPIGLAAEGKGATVRLELRDGTRIQGELLAVKGEELLLLSDAGGEARASIRDIAAYCIVRKGHFPRVMSKCMLGGMALGALGSLPFTNRRTDFDAMGVMFCAGFGLAAGTLVGILAGATSSPCNFKATKGTNDAWVEKTLDRLRQSARFPSAT